MPTGKSPVTGFSFGYGCGKGFAKCSNFQTEPMLDHKPSIGVKLLNEESTT